MRRVSAHNTIFCTRNLGRWPPGRVVLQKRMVCNRLGSIFVLEDSCFLFAEEGPWLASSAAERVGSVNNWASAPEWVGSCALKAIGSVSAWASFVPQNEGSLTKASLASAILDHLRFYCKRRRWFYEYQSFFCESLDVFLTVGHLLCQKEKGLWRGDLLLHQKRRDLDFLRFYCARREGEFCEHLGFFCVRRAEVCNLT